MALSVALILADLMLTINNHKFFPFGRAGRSVEISIIMEVAKLSGHAPNGYHKVLVTLSGATS